MRHASVALTRPFTATPGLDAVADRGPPLANLCGSAVRRQTSATLAEQLHPIITLIDVMPSAAARPHHRSGATWVAWGVARGHVVGVGLFRRHRMGFKPKRAGGRKGIYSRILPP